ncbi:hypothetical protein WJX81_008464 [Elliptochloris bilobata]|uniref:ABC transmembrane type-1 domain-containing protein n=1 Tax=Elliptochloris bilobata TaxID=381761 RepID=A0AAW1RQZ8_9CHLO
MFDWLKRSIVKRAFKSSVDKHLRTAEDNLQRAEHNLRAAVQDSGHGLHPGDRPALLLVAVLLLMLGQWVVVAALLTIEALSTVAGTALLAIALQARSHSMEKMASEVTDMNDMLHILKAKTKWLPGQPTMRWEEVNSANMPKSTSHDDLRSPFQ